MVATASRRRARSVGFARLASGLVTAAALAVLAGWLLHVPGLTSLYLPGPTLKTNTAICLAALGIGNLLFLSGRARSRWLAVALTLPATAVGALTLLQHVAGWDFGIDQLIATEPTGALATASPNRMGPPASTAVLLLGSAMLLLESRSLRGRVAGQVFAFVGCTIALLPVMGYAYGFSELYSLAGSTGIAMITAMALLALGLAIQAGRPDFGLTALVCRDDEVGAVARELLHAGAVVPFVMGWALSRLYTAGLIDAAFAIASMAIGLIVVLAAVTWRTGAQLAEALDARARTERALSESERSLREADQQKTEFLATLSHELRNPLAPIRFAVELLGGPAPAAERARQTIARQVQHLTRLIDDLLDLTRISRNRLELAVRPCELRPLVADAAEAVATDIARARQRLEIALPPSPAWLLADPDRVVQMLVNLLTNASRYTPPGGTIEVSARAEDAGVTICVRDCGYGIDPADLERVFERFVQVGEGRRGGLGIGLAIVKALAELHGGRVEARSAGRGHGSEFRVRLPRATAPPVRPTASEGGPISAPRRILVVDDDRDAADMLAAYLRATGHHVACAYDGAEALRVAPECAPEVALIDLGMAGMDGYELAARLRAERPGGVALFLVAITGWGQDEDRRRALAAGFDAHMTKPVEPEALAALLRVHFAVPVPQAARQAMA